MIKCDAYELLSFWANNLEMTSELEITAERINRLSDMLRMENIRCDFSLQAFERAGREYPERFFVTEKSVIVKSCPDLKEFVFYDSNEDVVIKIKRSWQLILKEY